MKKLLEGCSEHPWEMVPRKLNKTHTVNGHL